MVVHPSPGHHGGTLVNAVLHHYSLPAVTLDSANDSGTKLKTCLDPTTDSDLKESSDDELPPLPQNNQTVIRPGIVHRLDKGTTGLMVVCRTDEAMLYLGEQFRDRTERLTSLLCTLKPDSSGKRARDLITPMQINRLYWSVTVGVPEKASGEVCTNIGRHPSDRLKMAVYGFGSSRGREAISTYKFVSY